MFTLKPLPYSYTSLEPYISETTLQFHHDKHHQAYVNKLNDLLKDHPDLLELEIEELLTNLDRVPESIRQTVINNGGQFYNHNLYWEVMGPNTPENPSGDLAEKISQTFGSFEDFRSKFSELGTTQFGSGWAWLSVDNDNNLVIEKTGNADTPLMHGKKPILTMDVWEHAYYLDYQNKRPEYISNFFKVINWDVVAEKYTTALS